MSTTSKKSLEQYKKYKQKLGLKKPKYKKSMKVIQEQKTKGVPFMFKKPVKCFAVLSHGADYSLRGNSQTTTIPNGMSVVRYTKPGKFLYPHSLPFIVNKTAELVCKTGDVKLMKSKDIEYYMPIVKIDRRSGKAKYDDKIYKTTHKPFVSSQGETIINIPLEFTSHPTWKLGLYELDFKTKKLEHSKYWMGNVSTNLGEVLRKLSEKYPAYHIILHQLSCREGEIKMSEVQNKNLTDLYIDDTLSQLFSNISVSEDPSFHTIENRFLNGEIKVLGVFKDKKKARQVLNNLKEYTPPWSFFN